ncbi:MAG: hypothetical protein ACRCT8_02840 [Lacipirellulaceae bacterium]
MTLVAQLITLASDDTAPLSRCLLRAKVLADELNSDDLAAWVDRELTGYPNASDLPQYRYVSAAYFGHFDGPFGSGTRNVPMPIPADAREYLATRPMLESVSALETLVVSGNAAIKFLPVVGLDFFRKYSCYIDGQVLNHVVGKFNTSDVVEVLASARSGLLDFLLALRKSHPLIRSDDAAPNDVLPDQTKDLVAKHIYSNCTFVAGDNRVGDHYSIKGQAGVVGPNASVQIDSFDQVWNEAE